MARSITVSILCLALAYASPASAEVAADKDDAGAALRGLHGGPEVRWTLIGGADALLVGGEVGWLFDDFFVIGAGGFALADASGGMAERLRLGYGAARLGVVFFSRGMVHVAPLFLVGGGALSLPQGAGRLRAEDGFFLFEPTLELELAPLSFLRVGGSLSYRMVSNIEVATDGAGLDAGDVAGPEVGGFFKVGFF
jgi:hypothetical protein